MFDRVDKQSRMVVQRIWEAGHANNGSPSTPIAVFMGGLSGKPRQESRADRPEHVDAAVAAVLRASASVDGQSSVLSVAICPIHSRAMSRTKSAAKRRSGAAVKRV